MAAVIEKRLRAMLAANTDITDLVDQRIVPVVLLVETGVPSIVYRRMGSDPEYTLAGRAGWRTVRIQVACWAAAYNDARWMAELVRRQLDGYSETESEGSIRFVSVADEPDEYVDLGEISAYGAIQMVTIEYDDEAVTL